MYAAATRDWEVVRMLLEEGADVGAHNKEGKTAMNILRVGGHREAVKLLNAKGATE